MGDVISAGTLLALSYILIREALRAGERKVDRTLDRFHREQDQ